jgi:hypothetical protein
MDADWSVELGAEDPILELPWSSPDGTRQFVDLSEQPEAIDNLPEVVHYRELAKVLIALNSALSPWLTVKCDVWIDDELGEAEEIYDGHLKVCSYLDLVRRNQSERISFEQHEQWVKSAASDLRTIRTDEPIACEFIVRRCWYHPDSRPDDEAEPGLYVTLYVFGYGDDEAEARATWAAGVTLATDILLGLRE